MSIKRVRRESQPSSPLTRNEPTADIHGVKRVKRESFLARREQCKMKL